MATGNGMEEWEGSSERTFGGPVGAEVREQPRGIDEEQADGADDRDLHLVLARAVTDLVRQPEDRDEEDGEEHERRGVVRQPRPEGHLPVGPADRSGGDREPKHEERVREERAEDRELGDDDLAGRECEEDDEQLGEVPERRLERPGDGRSEPRADRLGGDADRPGDATERRARDHEGDDRVGPGEMERTTDDRDDGDDRRPRVRTGHASLTNPIRSYIAESVGADAARALSAPTASRRRSSGSSVRSSRYRSRTGSEELDHRLPDIELEVAVPRPVVRPLDLLGRAVSGDRENVDEVCHTRLVVAPSDLASRVGHRRAELLPDHVGIVEQPHRPLLGAAGRRHLPRRLLEIHDPRADVRVDALRDHERLPEAGVEPLRDVPRELEVLALVVADRDAVGLVEQDVAGHQHGVREEPRRHELALVGLVLELGHPPELAVARDGREQPTRLGMRGDVALGEHRRALRVEPGRDEHREQVERFLVQVARVVLDGDRVEVDDAEERLAELLCPRVLAEAADVVAEMLVAGGLDAREDPHGFLSSRFAAERNLDAFGRARARAPACARTRSGGRVRPSPMFSRFGAERQKRALDTLAAWQ